MNSVLELSRTKLHSCSRQLFHAVVRAVLSRLEAPTLGALIAMYVCFASLHGCNQLEQCRSNCRGAKKQTTKKVKFLDTPSNSTIKNFTRKSLQ
jgi:hypothetical protein